MKKLIPLLLCCVLLCGCVFPTVPPAESIPTKPDEGTTEIATAPATEPETEPVTETITGRTVTIYYGNANADGLESAEVQVEDLTMDILVEQLIAYGVLAADVQIRTMEIDGTCLLLDFNTAFADHANTMGTSGEMILFGSVVNTFLTAWPEADSVYITAGGEIIETGHNVYDFELTFHN